MKVGDYVYLDDSMGIVVGRIITFMTPERFDLYVIKLYDAGRKVWDDYDCTILIDLTHKEQNRIVKVYENYEEVIENHFEVFI